MFQDAKLILENGWDGIVFGFLHNNHTIDKESTKRMVSLIHSYQKMAVFHRAFDVTNNTYNGKNTIRQLQKQYVNSIEILPGCGIHADNVKELIDFTQVHSFCKKYIEDTTTSTDYSPQQAVEVLTGDILQ